MQTGPKEELRYSLSLPFEVGSRVLALEYVEKLREAYFDLQRDPNNEDCLHDFRVRMRILRTHLKAYRNGFRIDEAKKYLKFLKHYSAWSGPCRDLQVQLHWFSDEAHTRHGKKVRGLNSVVSSLQGKFEKKSQKLAHKLETSFPHFSKLLEGKLNIYSASEIQKSGPRDGSFAMHLADSLERANEKLRQGLLKASKSSKIASLHSLRIDVKSVRYLLLPFKSIHEIRPVFKQLALLQDELGELHDRHVLLLALHKRRFRSIRKKNGSLESVERALQIQEEHFRKTALTLCRAQNLPSQLARIIEFLRQEPLSQFDTRWQ